MVFTQTTRTTPTVALPPPREFTSEDVEYFARIHAGKKPFTPPAVEPRLSAFPSIQTTCSCELIDYTCPLRSLAEAAEVEDENVGHLSEVWDADPKRPGRAFEKCNKFDECQQVAYDRGQYIFVRGRFMFCKLPSC